MAATGAPSMMGMEIPDDLARLAAEVDVDDAVIESTLSVDGEQFDASYRLPSVADAPDESPRHITQCPYEQYHRQGSQQLYRIPVGGIKCCNFCRRRVQEWVSAFTKVKNFHPMYDPAEFQQWACETMSQTKLRRFQALFDGLQLGELEQVTLELGTERLGFFQRPPSKAVTVDEQDRRKRLAAVAAFAQLDDKIKPDVISDMIARMPNAAELVSDLHKKMTAQQPAESLQQLLEPPSLQQLLEPRLQQEARGGISASQLAHDHQLLQLRLRILEAENQQLRQWQEQHTRSLQHSHEQLQQAMLQQHFMQQPVFILDRRANVQASGHVPLHGTHHNAPATYHHMTQHIAPATYYSTPATHQHTAWRDQDLQPLSVLTTMHSPFLSDFNILDI